LSGIGGQTKNLTESYIKNKAEMIAKQAAKKLLEKGAAFLAANPEILIIAIIIIVVVALFLIIITTIMGQNNASGVNAQPGPPPSQGQILTCLSNDYVSCLKQDFNIIVSGDRGDDLSRIYQSFAYAGQSKQYVNLLTNGGQQLKITMNYNSDGCHGDTRGFAGTILISGAGLCGTYSLPTFRYLLIHESGHVLNARNRQLFYSYPWSTYNSLPPDSSCYDQGFIKSYALRSGVNAKDESFAESIADSLRPRSNSGMIPPAQTINNFATECPATYSWFETNVFGGYTYF
jgi:flagellar basal body-associated protein FliL